MIEPLYTYAGQARLQLWWDTPNQAATSLVMIVLCLLSVSYAALQWAKKQSNSQAWTTVKWLLFSASFASVSILCYLVAQTYSRGGYVTLVVSLVAAIFLSAKQRWLSGVLLLLFSGSLLMLPAGASRATGTVNVSNDDSVSNRITLWKGAMAMTADHWLGGVGAEAFHDTYTKWYQPPHSKTRYRNAVNDYLTISSYWGIVAFFAYLATLLFVLYSGFLTALKFKSQTLLFLVLAIFSYAISGLFSTFIIKPKVSIILCVVVIASVAISVFKNGYNCKRTFRMPLLHSVSVAVFLSLGLLLLGFTIAGKLDVKPVRINLASAQYNVSNVAVAPRNMETKGVFIYLSDKGNELEVANSMLRELAARGYLAISPNLSSWGTRGLDEVRAFLELIKNNETLSSLPFFLVGSEEGARLAIVAAATAGSKLSGIISINGPVTWPFPRLSPDRHLSQLEDPLLIIHNKLGTRFPYEESKELGKLAKLYNKDVELKLLEGSSLKSDAGSSNAYNLIINFSDEVLSAKEFPN